MVIGIVVTFLCPLYPFYIFLLLWSTRVFPFAPTYSSIWDTFKKYMKIQEDLNKMEEATVDRQLSHPEMMIRKQLQEELWVTARSHESLLRQKARSRWIKEGDCNSRYFLLLWNNYFENYFFYYYGTSF